MPRKPKPHARKYERKADDAAAITPIEYGGLQDAFEHFSTAHCSTTRCPMFL